MQYLILGLGLGLGSGLSPGPLLALVISTTLRRGFGAGAKVSLAPLVTDAPIIAISVVFVHVLPDQLATLLGLAGGAYVTWLGVESLRSTAVEDTEVHDTDPLRRGVLVNLLSPHPWLFWMAVGGPILVAAWAQSSIAAAGFLVGFFGVLVGTKITMAGFIATGRHRLSAAGLHRAHQVAGAMLLIAGLALIVEFGRALLA